MQTEYYDKLEKLFESGLDTKEISLKSLELLEDEFQKHDENARWLANHYDSAAEYIAQEVFEMNDEDFSFFENIAEQEICIFKKYGYETACMEFALNRAKSDRSNLVHDLC